MDEFGKMVVGTASEPPNGEYEQHDRGLTGKQLYAVYPNGYGASIIQGPYSYGGPEGRYELAVLHGDDRLGYGSLCYATPVTSDVLGWLTPEDVTEKLHQINKLERNDTCTHKADRSGWNPFEKEDEHTADVFEALDSMIGSLTVGTGHIEEFDA